jgi:hypothetical protein
MTPGCFDCFLTRTLLQNFRHYFVFHLLDFVLLIILYLAFFFFFFNVDCGLTWLKNVKGLTILVLRTNEHCFTFVSLVERFF